jgi:hypothetical protein
MGNPNGIVHANRSEAVMTGTRKIALVFALASLGLAACSASAGTPAAPTGPSPAVGNAPAVPASSTPPPVSPAATAPASAVAAAPSVAPSGTPTLSPIQAVFTDALYHTVYTESATGTGLTYAWTVSMSADPHCAAGFKGNAPSANRATWYHADTTTGGPCDHTYYGAQGHPGSVTVVVTSALWRCTATYVGTLTGTGPAPAACVEK